METTPERSEEQRQNRSCRPGHDPTNELWEYINPDGTPEEEMVERVAEAIVSAVDPEEIILFGSAARGEMHEHSDLDLLVVKTGCEPDRRQTTTGCCTASCRPEGARSTSAWSRRPRSNSTGTSSTSS
jgi:hypothetical protein